MCQQFDKTLAVACSRGVPAPGMFSLYPRKTIVNSCAQNRCEVKHPHFCAIFSHLSVSLCLEIFNWSIYMFSETLIRILNWKQKLVLHSCAKLNDFWHVAMQLLGLCYVVAKMSWVGFNISLCSCKGFLDWYIIAKVFWVVFSWASWCWKNWHILFFYNTHCNMMTWIALFGNK